MQICCAGEVMVELVADTTADLYRRGVAGDSYNTAVYLARAGLSVNYLTRLGDDPYSDDIIARLTAEGIGTACIERCAGRQPGLYMVQNDAEGERHFRYWREQSPARELFGQPLNMAGTDVFYFTGITLAITRQHLNKLLQLLRQLRTTGCRIAFDPNYRAALWDSVEQAQQHMRKVLPLCHIALPTLVDDSALWSIDNVAQCQVFYRGHGIEELVIKDSTLTAHACTEDETAVQQATAVTAVDTTGAGDAFNAGYLAARLTGADMHTALTQAQHLAAAVVQQRGAILPHRAAPGQQG